MGRVLILLALSLGGCTKPNEEFQTPFLLLRGNATAPASDEPDGGEIPVYPVADPNAAGKPVD